MTAISNKISFYPLTKYVRAMPPSAGVMAALDLARSLKPSAPAETRAWLATVAKSLFDPWSRAAEMMARADAIGCGLLTAGHVLAGSYPPPELEDLVPAGPDAGHPTWHVLSPLYHAWRDAPLMDQDPQHRWRTTQAITQIVAPTEAGYEKWGITPNAERRILADTIRHARPTSIIDIGCGDGVWVRYLLDDFPGIAVLGCDLHQERLAAAHEFLSQRGRQPHLFQFDLLGNEPWPIGPVDMVILNRVLGCFTDEQHSRALDRIAETGAKTIFESNVTDSWELWRGRADQREAFARVGYRLTQTHSTGERLTDPLDVVRMRKNWPAGQVNIWERV